MTDTTKELTPIPHGSPAWKALVHRVGGGPQTRTCEGCGETFRKVRSTHMYCSPKCHLRVRRRRLKEEMEAAA